MNADSAFAIGTTHAVCQDYAIARNGVTSVSENGETATLMPYLILSDGCSSSADTDVGARLLVKAAEQTLLASRPAAAELPAMHTAAAHTALIWTTLTGLDPQAVDATLLTAHLFDDDLIVGCSGDGVIVIESWSDLVELHVISYSNGYPLYPSYQQQPERLQALQQIGCAREIKNYRANGPGEKLHFEGTRISDALTEVFSLKVSDCKYAALISDGIHSFSSRQQTETSKSAEPIPIEEIVRELISFKNTRGAFVSRRLTKFLRECETRGCLQRDDLAIAALYLGDRNGYRTRIEATA